jgi:hypothetical protein
MELSGVIVMDNVHCTAYLDKFQFPVKITAGYHSRSITVSISERKKEIRRRRKRREDFAAMKAKLPKADKTLKEKFAAKLRKLSPGADEVIKAWGLQ